MIHRVVAIDSVFHSEQYIRKVDTTCRLRPTGDGERITDLS